MSQKLRQFVSDQVELFRNQLEQAILDKLDPEESAELRLTVDFSLITRPRVQITTNLLPRGVDLTTISAANVPLYRWAINERVQETDEPVSLEAMAAAFQRTLSHDRWERVVVQAFAENGNEPITVGGLKKLGVPDSFFQIVRQGLRCHGVPFTINWCPRIGSGEVRCKLFSVKPPEK